jgi:pilus assembly protein FimV
MSRVKHPVTPKPASNPSTSPSDPASAAGVEPVTASEVRIKLDLARQFFDMGDPDSARQMLDEVLAEGDPMQQQEAQRLLDSLP